MGRITFVRNILNGFESTDKELLEKHFDVDEVKVPTHVVDWVEYENQLKRSISESNLTYTWFAGFHSYLASKLCRKYGKKLVVVAGGYDVANVPEINYGAFTNHKEKFAAIRVLINADMVLSVSKFNQCELLMKVPPKDNKLIYNGIDSNKFVPGNGKQDKVLTVGLCKAGNIRRKGFDSYVNAARISNHPCWEICGKDIDNSILKLTNSVTSNFKFIGEVNFDKLLAEYQSSRFYVQASYYESFGMALAEAMLCECVPITTNKTALPEIVGECGIIVPYGDPEAIAKAVEYYSTKDLTEMGRKARKRIIDNFSIQDRELKLKETLESVMNR